MWWWWVHHICGLEFAIVWRLFGLCVCVCVLGIAIEFRVFVVAYTTRLNCEKEDAFIMLTCIDGAHYRLLLLGHTMEALLREYCACLWIVFCATGICSVVMYVCVSVCVFVQNMRFCGAGASSSSYAGHKFELNSQTHTLAHRCWYLR